MRVVVDGFEGRAVGRRATHEPLCATVVRLAGVVPLADRLLDLVAIEATLLDALLRVGRPDVVLDRHRDAGAYGAEGTGFRVVVLQRQSHRAK